MKPTQNVTVAQMNDAQLALMRGTPDQVQKAAQVNDAYIQTTLREEIFCTKLVPESPIADADIQSDINGEIYAQYELQPDSPGGLYIPLGSLPPSEIMAGNKFRMNFGRIMTPEFNADIDKLRGYKTPLPQVMMEQSLKDTATLRDARFLQTLNRIVAEGKSGALSAGSSHAQARTGKIQWKRAASGGVNISNFVEAKKMMIRGSTTAGLEGRYRLRNYIALVNDATAQDFLKLDTTQVGDTTKGQMFKDGLTTDTFLGLKAIFTIKDDLLPDNVLFTFPAPEFIGKSHTLQDWTTFMERRGPMISTFAYWFGGMAIGNIAGVCRYDFA